MRKLRILAHPATCEASGTMLCVAWFERFDNNRAPRFLALSSVRT